MFHALPELKITQELTQRYGASKDKQISESLISELEREYGSFFRDMRRMERKAMDGA